MNNEASNDGLFSENRNIDAFKIPVLVNAITLHYETIKGKYFKGKSSDLGFPSKDLVDQFAEITQEILLSSDSGILSSDFYKKHTDELLRVIPNTTQGKPFLDLLPDIINVYEYFSLSTVELHLARVTYTKLLTIDDVNIPQIFEDAYRAIQTDEEHALVCSSEIQQFIDSSNYAKALLKGRKFLEWIEHKPEQSRFLVQAYSMMGQIAYYQFEFHKSRNWLNKAVLSFNQDQSDKYISTDVQSEQNRCISTAIHYLGRIAQSEILPNAAMKYFLNAMHFKFQCSPETFSTGWIHLRLAQVLIQGKQIDAAEDHLKYADKIFNISRAESSPKAQLLLAWADHYYTNGDYASAEKNANESIKIVLESKFPRGALLALEVLFWYNIKRGRLDKCLGLVISALRLLRGADHLTEECNTDIQNHDKFNGNLVKSLQDDDNKYLKVGAVATELQRNENLIVKYVLFKVKLFFMRLIGYGYATNQHLTRLKCCECPIHSPELWENYDNEALEKFTFGFNRITSA